ncbi:MAG: FmdE, Molybdenum formylmethanofuran dehydrogenase operon [Syntrophorhabdus sp. PtaU1.Bin050]|nr:MAG: FmdE, Molybdenum formylmethanofuran dehydrogenase operon [Syntrophorhabdus sp. PtaU1.Bin050]
MAQEKIRDSRTRDIGSYSFKEFKDMVVKFHGYPAAGVLIGGYMVEAAKERMPEGAQFEVIVETRKCLPDAVQLLTSCTVGNNWMRVVNLGRYALAMYEKYSGQGVRVAIDSERLKEWSHIRAWLLKLLPKHLQDSERLLDEIEKAGDSILSIADVCVRSDHLGKLSMGKIDICPVCREAYPQKDGSICKGCQGDAPYIDSVVANPMMQKCMGEKPV